MLVNIAVKNIDYQYRSFDIFAVNVPLYITSNSLGLFNSYQSCYYF